MSEAVVDDIVAVMPPLLHAIEALAFIARHLNPPDFDRMMGTVGAPEDSLRTACARLGEWPDQFADVRMALVTASDAALAAFAGLRTVQHGHGDLVDVFRALRYAPRAQEALYPLAERFPPVSEFFLDPVVQNDDALKTR